MKYESLPKSSRRCGPPTCLQIRQQICNTFCHQYCLLFFPLVLFAHHRFIFCVGLLNQVDYILGDNPLRMSYMVGYGSRYPQRIHHRASSLPSVDAHPPHIGCKAGSRYYLSPNPNPNLLVGAVVGGPNSSDAFPDSRPFFQESEPTTYINAPLVGLLAYFSAHP